MFLLCARGLQQHHVTVFMLLLLLLCKSFTIASFHEFLLSLFLSEVYCNIVLITGSMLYSSSCYGVHVVVCKRFTASFCYWFYVVIVLSEIYSIIVLRGSCCCGVRGLQHHRVTGFMLLL